MSFQWQARVEPLTPIGLCVRGEAARRLARRLIAQPRNLVGVHTRDALILLGDDLPWVDGVVYLGKEHPLDAVLLPTHLQPDWPASWIAQALQRQSTAPWAVLPDLIVGLSRASRLEAHILEEFCAHAPA